MRNGGSYIKQNHHLPDIAPATQMRELGIDLGDNQTRLLQKIEELTLYMIDQNNQFSEQKKQVDLQQNELAEFKEQNKKLEEQNRKLEAQQERIDRLEKLVGEKKESNK